MNPMEAFLGGGDKMAKKPLVEDEASSMKSGKISFIKPAGFKVPDGIKDGDPFDAMATVKFENGKLVLHEIDGTPVDDEPEAESEETLEEEYSDAPEEAMEEEPTEETPVEEEEEPEGEEPKDFLDAVEKKAKKGNPFAKK